MQAISIFFQGANSEGVKYIVLLGLIIHIWNVDDYPDTSFIQKEQYLTPLYKYRDS